MRTVHYIAMDTHSYSTEVCVKTRANTPGKTWRVNTTIPALREAIASVPRPRHLTFEEGPLASWLYRNLKADADRLVVCDPRKNALVAKGGDKDDAIDAGKLADSPRGLLIEVDDLRVAHARARRRRRHVEREHAPHVDAGVRGLLNRIDGRHDFFIQREPRRHDADDGEVFIIERQRLADDLRVCAEAALPEPIT